MNPFDLYEELEKLPETANSSGLMCIEVSFPAQKATEHVIHHSTPIKKSPISFISLFNRVFKKK